MLRVKKYSLMFSYARFLRMKCHCDPACIHYGDCCLDAAEKYSASQHDEVDEFWTCLPLRSKDNFRELDEMVYATTRFECCTQIRQLFSQKHASRTFLSVFSEAAASML